MGVSKNRGGPPKSFILIGFSLINHPFGVPLFLETPICFFFTPKIGEDEPNLTIIFFRWVGKRPPTRESLSGMLSFFSVFGTNFGPQTAKQNMLFSGGLGDR